MPEAVATPLAAFTVAIDPHEVQAFAASLGLPASPIPPTFPICFLFRPDVRAALAAFLPGGALPIHVGQRFRYHRPLSAGESLECTLFASPADAGRPFALVRLEMTDADGTAVCRAESEIVVAAPGFSWDRLK